MKTSWYNNLLASLHTKNYLEPDYSRQLLLLLHHNYLWTINTKLLSEDVPDLFLILATSHLFLTDSLITVESQSTRLIRETKQRILSGIPANTNKHTRYVALKAQEQLPSTNNALGKVVEQFPV